jgi:hypothetical protein
MSTTRPGFGTDPDIALARELPALRAAEQRLRAAAARQGITYNVADFGALRTQADTTLILHYRDVDYQQYVKAGGKLPINEYRRIAPFGRSYHNYGAAFDAVITGHPPTMTADQALGHLGALAPSVGLRWGASFNDRPHFELPLTLDAVAKLWRDYTNPTARADDAASKLDAIITAGVPGLSVIGQAATSAAHTLRATVARTPAARATITLGAVVVVGLLAWAAVRKFTED